MMHALMVIALVTGGPTALEGGVVGCRQIEDSLKRLVCYDGLAVAEAATPANDAAPAPAGVPADPDGETVIGGWHVATKKDPITDARRAMAGIESNERSGHRDRALLVIQCRGGEWVLLVKLGTIIGRDPMVTTRVDQGTPVTGRWEGSDDLRSASAFSKNVPALFGAIEKGKTLAVRVAASHSTETVTFDLTGSAEMGAEVRKRCR